MADNLTFTGKKKTNYFTTHERPSWLLEKCKKSKLSFEEFLLDLCVKPKNTTTTSTLECINLKLKMSSVIICFEIFCLHLCVKYSFPHTQYVE